MPPLRGHPAGPLAGAQPAEAGEVAAASETLSEQQLAERARRIAEERPTAEGVKGVCWYKATRKWTAHIHYKARQIHLGFYAFLADAIERRLLAEKALAEGRHPNAIQGVLNIGEVNRAAAGIAASPAAALSLPSGQKRERSATGCRAGTRASSLPTVASAPKRARRATTTQAVLSQAAILLALRAHRACW